MVSTRQSSNVGSNGSCGATDYSAQTRHTSYQTDIVPVSTPPIVPPKQLLNLPTEIFDKIFSYTGYKTVSQMRLVCRQFDKICGSILNSTFQKLQTQMLHRFQTIKAKMPRRESARRNHPLACESDIIETLHMRLTLLQMSFGKHIERKHCCFFAGEILDEVYRVLHYIRVTPKLARPYRVTDELFDLSTMAMEYFKEHIEPTLPEIAYFGTDFFDFPGSLQHSSNSKSWMLESPPHVSSKEYESSGPGEDRPSEATQTVSQSNLVLRRRIRKMKQGMKKHHSQLAFMRRELRASKSKIAEFSSRMDEYEKKNEETSRKFSTLLQELNKCITELQYWRSKSPLSSLCLSCGKAINGLISPEELQMFAQHAPSNVSFADAQPSTSAAEEPPWALREVDGAPVDDEEEVKTKQLPAAKRKLTAEEPQTPLSKKQKKSRSVLKARNKRS